MKAALKIFCGLFACGLIVASAQSPTPAMLVVQAANAPADPKAALSNTAQDSTSVREALKSLQEIKAANDETLKKQEAAVQRLDELQKAADQLKIFAHRTGG